MGLIHALREYKDGGERLLGRGLQNIHQTRGAPMLNYSPRFPQRPSPETGAFHLITTLSGSLFRQVGLVLDILETCNNQGRFFRFMFCFLGFENVLMDLFKELRF